jgi:hypothetical protein
MAYRNGYDFNIRELQGVFRACFLPQLRWHIGRARRTARAQDSRTLHDEARQLPDVVAVLVTNQ